MSNIDNFFNNSFRPNKNQLSGQTFTLKVFSSGIAIRFERIIKAIIFMLLFLLTTLTIIGTLQAQEPEAIYFKPSDNFIAPHKTESVLSSKIENLLSLNLTNQLAACAPSQISYGQTAFGNINTSDCVVNGRYSDEYTFSGTAGQQISIGFGTYQFNGFVQVLDANGFSFAGSSMSRFTTTLPSTGSFTIRVSALEQSSFYQTITGGNYYLSLAQGSPACNYNLSLSGFFPYDSNAITRDITVATTSGCLWNAFSNDSWITINSGSSGNENGTVNFTLAVNNSTEPRRGSITIGGLDVFIYQAGNKACSTSTISYGQTVTGDFSTSDCTTHGRYSNEYSLSGNAGDQIAVSTIPTTLSPQPIRIILLSPDGIETVFTGSGQRLPLQGYYTLPVSGVYRINVAPTNLFDLPNNTGSYTLSLERAASGNCVYTLLPTNATVAASGSAGTIGVGTGDAQTCSYSVVSNDSWITITSGSSGTGNGTVSYNVAPNDGTARSGSISIAGQTFTVRQMSGITPPNNDFANAQEISGKSGSLVASNVDATAEAGEKEHAGTGAAHSVWYKWHAPEDGLFSFTTIGSNFDTLLGVYSGNSVNALFADGESDDTANFDLTGKVVFRALGGNDYYIAVDAKNNPGGIINLSWKQAARTYRFYAQTGNGEVSSRVPVVTATRSSDGLQVMAQPVSTGVYELDLPVDNAVYQVSIGGADTWSPNSFTLDNFSANRAERVSQKAKGGVVASPSSPMTETNLTTTAVTPAGTVSGVLQGITSTSGVTVFLGSEGGPNPIAPKPCQVSLGTTGAVVYMCQFIVDTRHQIKPSLAAEVFEPANRQYNQPLSGSLIPGAGTQFQAKLGTTYIISGRVTANGVALANVTISLSGRKTNSFITGESGSFQFNALPAGGAYTIQAALPGYDFAAQTITDLQSNQTLDITARDNCTYNLSGSEVTIGAGGGAQSFIVNTGGGCPWKVANDASWISVTASSGFGSGTVYFNVQTNTSERSRSATLLVAGRTFTVVQDKQADPGCSFSINPTVQGFSASGGDGSTAITTGAGCRWSTLSNESWITITSGAAGAASGMTGFRVAANAGAARTGTVFVAGQTLTINQAADKIRKRPKMF